MAEALELMNKASEKAKADSEYERCLMNAFLKGDESHVQAALSLFGDYETDSVHRDSVDWIAQTVEMLCKGFPVHKIIEITSGV